MALIKLFLTKLRKVGKTALEGRPDGTKVRQDDFNKRTDRSLPSTVQFFKPNVVSNAS